MTWRPTSRKQVEFKCDEPPSVSEASIYKMYIDEGGTYIYDDLANNGSRLIVCTNDTTGFCGRVFSWNIDLSSLVPFLVHSNVRIRTKAQKLYEQLKDNSQFSWKGPWHTSVKNEVAEYIDFTFYRKAVFITETEIVQTDWQLLSHSENKQFKENSLKLFFQNRDLEPVTLMLYSNGGCSIQTIQVEKTQ